MSLENTVYIFDVDGVLSDVFVDEIDSEILSLIAKIIENGSKVALNTGRNSTYILENVITPLSRLMLSSNSLDNILVVSEMGGERTTFSQGIPTTSHTEFSMESEDIQTSELIFHNGDYKNMKFEHDKSTMVSVSIVAGSKNAEFIKERDHLKDAFTKAFDGKPIEIITTVGSVDVFVRGAGKKGGAKVIGEWLSVQSDIKHDAYVCFGDSPSDYAMAVYFAEQDMNVTFIFTGEEEQMPIEKAGVPIIKTAKPYTAGTKAYLASNR